MAVHSDDVYERARLARDARFDGHFFVAVRTTGIYCRPVCPANPPRRKNVRFFPTAAAAGEAGFRPCLRCRPETAPGSPAWLGTSTTVRRALRLIAHGALDEGNVEALAERLGVTSRHLRRLFTKHLGAAPLSVAHTQRLHFAKRLIDDSALPMTDVALAAGFGSVRRFNDAFRNAYARSPRELRALRRRGDGDRAELTLKLPYRPPYAWCDMLRFFAARAIPGVEAVVGDRYQRTLTFGERQGVLDVAAAESGDCLTMSIAGVDTQHVFEVAQRAREMFDVDAPVDDIRRTLGRDPALAERLKAMPGPRVVGAWDGFELTVRAILGQQVTVAAATSLAGRVAARYGTALDPALAERYPALSYVFPSAAKLSRAHFNDMGIVGSRIAAIRALAQSVSRGTLSLAADADPEETYEQLLEIAGIGDWTAQYVLMRALKMPDAFPAADLGLMKNLEPGRRLTPAELKLRAEDWRPWRAYAAALLWHATPDSGG